MINIELLKLGKQSRYGGEGTTSGETMAADIFHVIII